MNIPAAVIVLAAVLLPPAGRALAAPAAGATTLENLQAAFDGESNARARYEAFAAKADEEGYAGAAGLFRAAAKAESVHAARHAGVIRSMGAAPRAEVRAPEVRSTVENLKAARDGEDYERRTMYPRFIEKARADKNAAATDAFEDAKAVEAVHFKLFSAALSRPGEWRTKRSFLVCRNCGNTTQDMEFKRCSVCSWPRSEFMRVD